MSNYNNFKKTTVNTAEWSYIQSSKGKRIYTKAEYAVAHALTRARNEKGLLQTQVSEEFTQPNTQFKASYFFTTDQYKKFMISKDPKAFWPTASEHNMVDNWNIEDDIDLVLADQVFIPKASDPTKGYTVISGKAATVSVKCMSRPLVSGKLNIEVETFNTANPSLKRQGWIYTSKADWYAFCLGHKVMMVLKSDLLKVVASKEWDLTPPLTPAQAAKNAGRVYDNARSILVDVDSIMPFARVLDLPEWYTEAWDNSSSIDDYYKNRAESFWTKYTTKEEA